MLSLSKKLESVEESQTLATAARAKQLRGSGVDVISLTAGEPDFSTPRHVKDSAIRAIEGDFTHYTANQGTRELVDAIIQKFDRENDLRFGPDQVLVSTGAKQSIYNVLQAICNPGDEVIILSPYWVSYPEMVKLADAIPIIVKSGIAEGFRPDVKKIREAITPRTKAIILNSPGNPSGIAYSRGELSSLAGAIQETGIFVISDEIYEKVIFDQNKHYSIGAFDNVRDQVITVNGVSKAYAMTGWRIGFAGGPGAVMQVAAKVQSQATSNANSIAQKATVAALNGDQSETHRMTEEFQKRRDLVWACLSEIPRLELVRPEGAFYILLGVGRFYGRSASGRTINNSTTMADYLLERHGVALVPGIAFGADDCVRLSYACSRTELQRGLEKISGGLRQLLT